MLACVMMTSLDAASKLLLTAKNAKIMGRLLIATAIRRVIY